MATIYSWVDDYTNTLKVDDSIKCDGNETYLGTPLFSSSAISRDFNASQGYELTKYWVESVTGELSQNGRRAILAGFVISGAPNFAIFHSQYGGFNGKFENYGSQGIINNFNDAADFIPGAYSSTIGGHDQGARFVAETTLATNIPIFKIEDIDQMNIYLTSSDDLIRHQALTYAVNYDAGAEYDLDTQFYYISNEKGQAAISGNTATAEGAKSWRSMRFYANETPVAYFNEDYSITLVAPSVVKSVTTTGPDYILDSIPESSWVENRLAYDGLWYGSLERRLRYTGEPLPDGSYMYGWSLDTNIYIFANQADALTAIETGDYTPAENYDVVNGGDYPPPLFGTEEEETEFGSGADTSPFMQTYILSRNALIQVAQKWYNTDPATLTDILTGLKMFGDKPYESISGITMYPFDVTRILSTISQTYIYFGTYKMEMGQTSLNKASSLVSNAFLDCGTIFLAPLFKSYRDFEPFVQLDLYLPYIGWVKADIATLIGKNVNVRYYVDIHTRACIACILANGVLVANHSGTIGVGLPATSADYQGYANSVAGTLIGSGGGVIKSAGSALASAATGNYLGAIANVGAAAVGTASTLYQLEKLGAPADHATTKGNYTAALGCYMPQYVLFRYTIHDPIEPSNFSAMCGRPSGVSKNIGAFSGFLSCKQVKLNTSGMLDAEAAEIEQLLKGGIYL